MLTAVATVTAAAVSVVFVAAEDGGERGGQGQLAETDLNPIAPELKEIIWGFGSFVVLALLMRFFLYPRLRKGMDARYDLIRGGHEQAEQVTDAARGDVAAVRGAAGGVRAEAQQRIEAARSDARGASAPSGWPRSTPASPSGGPRAATEVEQARPGRRRPTSRTPCGPSPPGPASWRPAGRPTPSVVSAAVADVMSAGVSR